MTDATADLTETRTDWGRYGRRPVVVLALVALVDAVDHQRRLRSALDLDLSGLS